MITLMLVALGFGTISLALRYLTVYPSEAEYAHGPLAEPARQVADSVILV